MDPRRATLWGRPAPPWSGRPLRHARRGPELWNEGPAEDTATRTNGDGMSHRRGPPRRTLPDSGRPLATGCVRRRPRSTLPSLARPIVLGNVRTSERGWRYGRDPDHVGGPGPRTVPVHRGWRPVRGRPCSCRLVA